MTASTTTPTRAERYIYAAVQSLPEKQRADVAAELRGSIQDAIDARMEQGLAAEAAETAVLTELGDPERLAASFSGRQLYLIGPDIFLTYQRVLKQVMLTVLPIIMCIGFVVDLFDDKTVIDALTGAVGGGFTVALHIGFWVTLVFAIIERADPKEVESMRAWSLDRLPNVSPRSISRGDMLSGIAFAIIPIALIILQTRRSFASNDAGDSIPVLNPDLWSFGIPAFIALLLASAVFEVVKYRAGTWSVRLAVVNLTLNAAFVVLTGWLALSGDIVNPELYAVIDWSPNVGGSDPIGLLTAISVGVICAWDSAEGFYHALRRTPQPLTMTAPI